MPGVIRKVVLVLLSGLGVALTVSGQYLLANWEMYHARLELWVGALNRHLMPDVYPSGVAVGLALYLCGTLLLACLVGMPPDAEPFGVRAGSPPPVLLLRGRRRWLWASASVLALLSAVGALIRPLHDLSVLAWLATFAVAFGALWQVDRERHTPGGNPFTWREWVLLLVLVGLDLALVAHDITHWRWAGTPDEAYFFQFAKLLAQGRGNNFLLSEHGVFEYHPVLSSYYQALFMKALGVSIFSWRLSSAAALAVSLPFVYLLTRELWNRRAALFATVFFGPAHLAVGFAHFGYNNVQAYPVVLGALAIFAWAMRRKSLSGYYLAGSVAGLGFYTYQPAQLTPFLVLLLGMLWGGLPWRRGDWRLTLAFGLGVLFTALPALMHLPDTISHAVSQTSVTGGRQVRLSDVGTYLTTFFASGGTAAHLLNHWLQSVLHPFWYKQPHHFQSNPIVDPFSGPCAAVGLWLSFAGARRRVNLRFLLLVYVLCALIVGATSPHERPPLTRLLFLSPFTAMYAAAVLDQAMRVVAGGAGWRVGAATALGGVVVLGSVVTNITTMQFNIYHRFHGYNEGTTSELIRIVQRMPEHWHIVLVQHEPTTMSGVDQILDEYGMIERFTYLHSVTPIGLTTLATLKPPFVVFSDLKPNERGAMEAVLAEHFPEAKWHDSDAGAPWNMRYLSVPEPPS